MNAIATMVDALSRVQTMTEVTNAIVTVDTYWLVTKHPVMVSAYNKYYVNRNLSSKYT